MESARAGGACGLHVLGEGEPEHQDYPFTLQVCGEIERGSFAAAAACSLQ